MTNPTPLAERTSAKIRYAQIHLAELKARIPLNGDDFQRAHEEAFLFHLFGARDAFLHEIDAAYNLALSDVSVRGLVRAFQHRSLACNALDKLIQLAGDHSSWYYRMVQMRHYVTHVRSLSRQYHIGGPEHQTVKLRMPGSGELTADLLIEFEIWADEMNRLLIQLRALLP